MSGWRQLDTELSRWAESGRTPTLWWRDDDAQRDSAPLRRLGQLSADHRIPLALAVIPDGLEASLTVALAGLPLLCALQHGYAHLNHAPAGERKCELGDHRPRAVVLAELARGRAALSAALGARFLPVLVPPWNRLAPALPAALAGIGLRGLSTLGPRDRASVEGLVQVNVHVDLINWRDGRRFAGDDAVLAQLVGHLRARRLGRVEAAEATGVMTHHLAHDAGCWRFLEALFGACAGRVRWCAAGELFSG